MTGQGRFVVSCLAMGILAVVTAPGVARGQVARHPSEIPAQLRTGTQLIRRALESLGDSQQAQTYTLQAYIQLRDAAAKMVNANGVAGFPYPLYTVAMPQVVHAKNQVQEALSCLQYPNEKGGAPQASIRLSEALNVTETVLLTLF
jgi:hypothetical protein